jgi:PPOX class probable F420-dependent enzyme
MGGMAFELTERTERHLTGDQIAWLTTVTPSGRPAPRPVWFIWDGTAIIVYSLNDGAKLRHIQANDQVAVHFNSSAEGGDVVVINGRAERVADAPIPSRFPGFLDKYAARITQMATPRSGTTTPTAWPFASLRRAPGRFPARLPAWPLTTGHPAGSRATSSTGWWPS